MKLIIDKDYTVSVKVVSEKGNSIFHKYKLKINGNGIENDLYTHLLFNQYLPWYDEQTEKIFLNKIDDLFNKWSIKKKYGKLCISKVNRINNCENFYTYLFKVSVEPSYDTYKVIIDISSKYKSTWMQNMMMECEKSIKNLIESILFTKKNDKKIDVWLNDIKKSMEYIPGCKYNDSEKDELIKGKIYFVLNNKTQNIYLIDYRKETDNKYGLVYEITDNENRSTSESVNIFLSKNSYKDFSFYTFVDDYFGEMFINVYKNR